jgi:hypothetical protein
MAAEERGAQNDITRDTSGPWLDGALGATSITRHSGNPAARERAWGGSPAPVAYGVGTPALSRNVI